MKKFAIHRGAEIEAREAIAFYETQKNSLGRRFRAALTKDFRSIRKFPNAYPWHESYPVQFLIMNRFPYVIYFANLSPQIVVIAVAHTSRQPGYWLRRIP